MEWARAAAAGAGGLAHLGTLWYGQRCTCQVDLGEGFSVDRELLRLLEGQVQRCGPANLTVPAPCPPPECTGQPVLVVLLVAVLALLLDFAAASAGAWWWLRRWEAREAEGPLHQAESLRLQADGAKLAEQERRDLGLEGMPPLPPPAEAPPALALEGTAHPEEGEWRFLETRGEARLGELVGFAALEAGCCQGDRGVANVGDAFVSCAFFRPGEQMPTPRAEGRRDEPPRELRTLPAKYETSNRRHRSCKEAASLTTTTAFDDWPISGPRTAEWLAREIARRELTPAPVRRHFWWRQPLGLGPSVWGVGEHEALSRLFECALKYDQLNFGELAALDFAGRRHQLLEERRARARVAAAAGGDSGHLDDDMLFVGEEGRHGRALVAPALGPWISHKLSEESAVLTERRMAMEERQLARSTDATPSAGSGQNDDKPHKCRAAAGSVPTAETSRVPPSPDSTAEGHYAEGGDWNDWWQRASSAWDSGGRGLDAGLSKTAPTYELLKTDGYRVFRRKLEVFERCCRKRGTTAISEGAFLIMNSLQGEAAEATEDIDLDQLESEGAFKPLFQVLDEHYKYDNQTELPARTDQFFGKFARQDKETMKLYCLRHKRELRKLKEVGMEIPDMLAGWHLLSRAAVPPSGAAQVRSQCASGLSWMSVKKALLDAYGAEAVPDKRDVKRVERMLVGQGHKDDVHYTNDYEWERGLSYEDSYLEEEEYDYDEYEEYDAEEYEEEADVAEELPQDVEEAQIACDEAYLSFVDAKRRVAEIAKSRGFYPIVVVAPDNNFQHGKGASRPAKPAGGKGKGRSKGKGKGKGTGSRQVFRPKVNIFNRRREQGGYLMLQSSQRHLFKRWQSCQRPTSPPTQSPSCLSDLGTRFIAASYGFHKYCESVIHEDMQNELAEGRQQVLMGISCHRVRSDATNSNVWRKSKLHAGCQWKYFSTITKLNQVWRELASDMFNAWRSQDPKLEEQSQHRLRMGRWRKDAMSAVHDVVFWRVVDIAALASAPLDHVQHFLQRSPSQDEVLHHGGLWARLVYSHGYAGKCEKGDGSIHGEFTAVLTDTNWKAIANDAADLPPTANVRAGSLIRYVGSRSEFQESVANVDNNLPKTCLLWHVTTRWILRSIAGSFYIFSLTTSARQQKVVFAAKVDSLVEELLGGASGRVGRGMSSSPGGHMHTLTKNCGMEFITKKNRWITPTELFLLHAFPVRPELADPQGMAFVATSLAVRRADRRRNAMLDQELLYAPDIPIERRFPNTAGVVRLQKLRTCYEVYRPGAKDAMAVAWHGKAKTASQLLALQAMLAGVALGSCGFSKDPSRGGPDVCGGRPSNERSWKLEEALYGGGAALLWLAAALTLASGGQYARALMRA
ncbi:unnamed protein product [Prorocentrum cordatum]|uniref:Uncharacterized protein n=1 Tax=Prorocentrum cordatum TaxID=2364126 RepID=A0ABN9UFD1_9DINO|nr:unnamed protein product [Polarella glacialis]